MDHYEGSLHVRGSGKRKWTTTMDDELIKTLYEISLDPAWKGEGGFKDGYCSLLETHLAERFPGCGLSAPHIMSRVRHFRTKYFALEEMLNKSGFYWDERSKMLRCHKEEYVAYCKDHTDARGLYGTTFPYDETLAVIYGREQTQ